MRKNMRDENAELAEIVREVVKAFDEDVCNDYPISASLATDTLVNIVLAAKSIMAPRAYRG